MSNLKLPTMTYAHLSEKMGGTWVKKLAYATVARSMGDGPTKRIEIVHHDSVIATLWPNGDVKVTNAGYDTSTTINRIHKVLVDNDKPIGVRIRNYGSYWFPRNTSVLKPFHTLTLLHDGTIIDPNEEVNR